MSVYRLCRARGWTRQEPGRVDRMVRRLGPRLCRLRTVSLDDAVDSLFGFQPGDTIAFKVQGLFDEGAPYSSASAPPWPDPSPTAPANESVLRYLRATLDPRRYVSSHWAFAGVGDRAYLGYAWPPAGDERRPAQWPGQDDNKNRSKTMAWNAAGTIRPADLDDRVQVGADNIRDPFPDEERESEEHVQKLRERLATEQVHLLASRFLTGIREAEDLGLEVRVEQVCARQNNNEWRRVAARTEQLRVGVTKMVGLMVTSSNLPPDRLPERPSPEESAALTAAGFASLQERDAVVAVDEAAWKLLKAIVAAEAAGLTVEVRWKHDRILDRGDGHPRALTTDVRVDITKRLR